MSGEIASILMNISFALGFVLTRKIEKDFTPLFINSIRSLLGFIAFTTQCAILDIFPLIFSIPINLVLLLCASILFTVILGDTFYFKGQKILGPIFALGIATITPFITYILAIIFLGEIFSFLIFLSAILIGTGVIVIVKLGFKNEPSNATKLHIQEGDTKKSPEQQVIMINTGKKFESLSNKNNIKGISYILFASISWAVGMILTDYSLVEVEKILLIGSKTVFVAYSIRFTFATAFLLILSFFFPMTPTEKIETKSWGLVFLSAIIGGIIGSYFYGEAARLSGATIVALVSTSLPLFTIPFSYFINHEKITKWGFLGILLTISGVILILI